MKQVWPSGQVFASAKRFIFVVKRTAVVHSRMRNISDLLFFSPICPAVERTHYVDTCSAKERLYVMNTAGRGLMAETSQRQ